MPFGRITGAALPLKVAGGAAAEEVLLPGTVALLDIALLGRAEPLYVIVVGPVSVMVDVRVLVL